MSDNDKAEDQDNPLTFHDRASLVIEAFDPIEAHTAELEQRIERELVWAHHKGMSEAAPELAKAVARIEELEQQLAEALADPGFVRWRAYFQTIAPETSEAPLGETGRFSPPPGTASSFPKELAQIVLGIAELDAALLVTASPTRGFEIASLVLEESPNQKQLHMLFEVMGTYVERMINQAIAAAGGDPEGHHPRCPANPNVEPQGPCMCGRGPKAAT